MLSVSRIFKNKFLLFLFIFPFFNPTALKFIAATEIIYDVIQIWKLVAILVIVFIYLLLAKHSKIVILVLGYCFIYLITSLINGIINQNLITDILLILGFTMLVDMAINCNFNAFAKMLFNITFALAIINFFSILIFPNGIPFVTSQTLSNNPQYFIAIDNGLFKSLTPLLFISYYFIIINLGKGIKAKRKILYVIAIIIVGLSILLSNTATGILAYVIFNFIMIFYLISNLKNYRMFLLFIYLFLFIFIILFGTEIGFVDFIANLVGRSSTFSGRRLLWDNAIELIKKSPLFGYGNNGDMIEVWGGNYSSHNLLLELALKGGLVLVVYFIYLTIYSFLKLKQSNKFSILISVALFALLINGLTEVGVEIFYFALIVMSYYSSEFIIKNKVNNINKLTTVCLN